MSRETKDKAVRFRVTSSENQHHVAAANKLGIIEMSEFYRWALNNSATAVLGVTAQGEQLAQARPRVQAEPKPKRPPLPKLPGFAKTPDFYRYPEEPAEAPPPAPPPEPVEAPPELQQLLGVPLYARDANGPAPLPFDDDYES